MTDKIDMDVFILVSFFSKFFFNEDLTKFQRRLNDDFAKI